MKTKILNLRIKWRKKWKEIAKEWSTWALALSAVIPTVQAIILQINTSPGMEVIATNPAWQVFSVVVAVLGIIAKNIPQDGALKIKKEELLDQGEG